VISGTEQSVALLKATKSSGGFFLQLLCFPDLELIELWDQPHDTLPDGQDYAQQARYNASQNCSSKA